MGIFLASAQILAPSGAPRASPLRKASGVQNDLSYNHRGNLILVYQEKRFYIDFARLLCTKLTAARPIVNLCHL